MARVFETNIDMNSENRVINLLDPSAAQDAATKAYVDGFVQGLAWKNNVRAASTGNVNTSSPGASIDSVSLSSSDRILLKDQSTAHQNGIYIWNGAASALTRADDASTFDELESAIVTVDEGTTNAETTWRQSAVNGTIGVDDVVWESFGTATPNATETVAGIVEIATTSEVNAGTATGGTGATLVVSPDDLVTYTGRIHTYKASFGDGSNTSYTITHNLGTRDVIVQIYRNSGDYDQVEMDVQHTSTTAVTIVASAAPSTNQFRVVIIALD